MWGVTLWQVVDHARARKRTVARREHFGTGAGSERDFTRDFYTGRAASENARGEDPLFSFFCFFVSSRNIALCAMIIRTQSGRTLYDFATRLIEL